MRIIGVIDLLDGKAVHARAGHRASYAPVSQAAGIRVDGDALALVEAYRSVGVTDLYVADLDAIVSRAPPSQVVTSIAREAGALWLDAGIGDPAGARNAIALGATRVVIGLETLFSFGALRTICDDVGGERVVFSLDLRNGAAISGGAVQADETPEHIAVRAADAGAASLIVLDLARVGTGSGPDLDLTRRVNAAAPGLATFAGGGVRGLDDLEALARIGCDGALVATALHDGRITRA
jgi:phosphoribosylformimino-5-aminoimidazole carboxamide ribotide isomerase